MLSLGLSEVGARVSCPCPRHPPTALHIRRRLRGVPKAALRETRGENPERGVVEPGLAKAQRHEAWHGAARERGGERSDAARLATRGERQQVAAEVEAPQVGQRVAPQVLEHPPHREAAIVPRLQAHAVGIDPDV